MDARKIIPVLLLVLAYGLYNVRMWFTVEEVDDNPPLPVVEKDVAMEVVRPDTGIGASIANGTGDESMQLVKKYTYTRIKDSCSVLEVFTNRPPKKCKEETRKEIPTDSSALTVIGITVFLLVLVVNAVLDVLKVKEEERARLKQNPDGERRQSLAEFANRKPLKRESSRIGQQLFQIAEAIAPIAERKPKKIKPYVRGESTNSYLSEKNSRKDECSMYFNNMDTDNRFVKRQSVAKLYGVNSTPMMRRCSFPALPLNPEVQALMMDGFRRPSTDSDEESDCKRRRIRLIRRY